MKLSSISPMVKAMPLMALMASCGGKHHLDVPKNGPIADAMSLICQGVTECNSAIEVMPVADPCSDPEDSKVIPGRLALLGIEEKDRPCIRQLILSVEDQTDAWARGGGDLLGG